MNAGHAALKRWSSTAVRTVVIKVKSTGQECPLHMGKIKGDGKECPFHTFKVKSNVRGNTGAAGVRGSHPSQKTRRVGHPLWMKGAFEVKVNVRCNGHECPFHTRRGKIKIKVKGSGRERPLYTHATV